MKTVMGTRARGTSCSQFLAMRIIPSIVISMGVGVSMAAVISRAGKGFMRLDPQSSRNVLPQSSRNVLGKITVGGEILFYYFSRRFPPHSESRPAATAHFQSVLAYTMNNNTAVTSPIATLTAATLQVPRINRTYRAEPKLETNDENELARIRARQISIRDQFSAALALLDDNAE